MNSVLGNMLDQLSEEDRQEFDGLSERLKRANGNIARLAQEDRQLIRSMEAKYGESINRASNEQVNNADKVDILDMPFAQKVRQILARDLGSQLPLEEEAVAFVFQNKWLPVDCQDERLIDSLYQRFETDIHEVNQWRKEMVDIDTDKKMALGLAWFMVIYQLHKRLSS